jgi:hypothetical protein
MQNPVRDVRRGEVNTPAYFGLSRTKPDVMILCVWDDAGTSESLFDISLAPEFSGLEAMHRHQRERPLWLALDPATEYWWYQDRFYAVDVATLIRVVEDRCDYEACQALVQSYAEWRHGNGHAGTARPPIPDPVKSVWRRRPA